MPRPCWGGRGFLTPSPATEREGPLLHPGEGKHGDSSGYLWLSAARRGDTLLTLGDGTEHALCSWCHAPTPPSPHTQLPCTGTRARTWNCPHFLWGHSLSFQFIQRWGLEWSPFGFRSKAIFSFSLGKKKKQKLASLSHLTVSWAFFLIWFWTWEKKVIYSLLRPKHFPR